MSKRISAARAAAFLKAVRETGNQTLAAARAKESRSWVVLHRRRDAAFDAAVQAAVAEARERLVAEAEARREQPYARGGTAAPGRWRFFEGHALAVRGTGGSRGSAGPKWVQVARARLKQWDVATEDRFLQALGARCNVKAACAEVGMTPASAYGHRQRWSGFRQRWDEALQLGFTLLETELVRAGWNLPGAPESLPRGPILGMNADHAIRLLTLHKAWVRRREAPLKHGQRRRPQTRDEMIATFEGKLQRIFGQPWPEAEGDG